MIDIDGWVSVHRKMLENPIVCKDSDHLAVWIYLLLNATHTDYDVLFEGERKTLKPGQLVTGRKSISGKLNINESKVQRILKTFESEQQIEQQTTSRNRLISIVNWVAYQQSEQQIEQQLNNKRTTTEQQMNTNNNIITKQHNNKDMYGELQRVWNMPITPVQAEAIDELVESFGEEKVKEGLKICAENSVFNLSYLKTVVKNGSKRKDEKPKQKKRTSDPGFKERTYDYAELERQLTAYQFEEGK